MAAVATQLIEAQQWMAGGQVEQAHALLKRLHKDHPKDTEILLQLGIAERLRQQWPAAITTLRQASSLAPDNLLYTEHLAMVLMLSNAGNHIVESIGKFASVLQARPDFYVMGANALTLALRNDLPQAVLDALVNVLKDQKEAAPRLHYAAACAIATYLLDDAGCSIFVDLALVAQSAAFDDEGNPLPGDLYFMLIYAEFLRDLLAFRAAHPALYAASDTAALLHVIGESHCLSAAHLAIAGARVQSHLIMGAKAYMFTPEGDNHWKYALTTRIKSLSKHEDIIVGFGELDCRAQEGIMNQWRAYPDYDFKTEIGALVARYVKFVKIAQLKRTGRCFIAGVPAPSKVTLSDLASGEETIFLRLFSLFNDAIRHEAAAQQLGFIDLYAAILGDDGWARDDVHIDPVHLKPDVVAQAFTAALA